MDKPVLIEHTTSKEITKSKNNLNISLFTSLKKYLTKK